MLKKSRRIARHDFPGPRSGGFTYQGEHLSLRHIPKNVEKSTFSVVISKKVAKTAPDRHRFKRRIYEIVAKKPHIPSGLYVFYAKKGATELAFKQLVQEVGMLLKGFNK